MLDHKRGLLLATCVYGASLANPTQMCRLIGSVKCLLLSEDMIHRVTCWLRYVNIL